MKRNQRHSTLQRRNTVLISAATLASMASMAGAQNLLVNGDFETGAVGAGAAGWTCFNNTSTSTEYARTTGGKAFKSFGPFFVGGGSVGLQDVGVTEGLNYQLSGYMFSPTADAVKVNNFGILQISYQNQFNEAIANTTIEAKFTTADPLDTWKLFTVNEVAPVGAAFAHVIIGHIQVNNPVTGGAIYWDDLSLQQITLATASNWINTGGGPWLTPGNWDAGGVPNSAGAVANFGSAITADAVVDSASPVVAGTVHFDNSHSYTLSGAGSLSLDVTTGTAAIEVVQGNHTISQQLLVVDSTNTNVAASSSVTIAGSLVFNSGQSLTSGGAGTTRIASAATVTGATGAALRAGGGTLVVNADVGSGVDLIANAGTLQIGATQHARSLAVNGTAVAKLTDVPLPVITITPSLTVATGAKLDLSDNGVVVDYPVVGPTPFTTVRSAIVSAYAQGTWTGNGITSSNLVAAPTGPLAIGYAEDSAINSPTTFLGATGIDSTSVLVALTYKGDTNLDRTVNFTDLLALAQNYGTTTGALWSQGDSNYDGNINFTDLLALAQNYGSTLTGSFAGDWALAQASVPEPMTASLAFAGTALMLRRRRA